jgi:ligand-binding SRPBCC domain-containing protein
MGFVRVETFLPASPSVCFDLARNTDVHMETAAGSGERVVSGPGRPLLELGDEVTFEARHFGIRQRLSARITSFDAPHEFTDEMVRGAFRSLSHRHALEAVEGGTKMIDELTFRSASLLFDRLVLDGYMRRFLVARGKALADIAARK